MPAPDEQQVSHALAQGAGPAGWRGKIAGSFVAMKWFRSLSLVLGALVLLVRSPGLVPRALAVSPGDLDTTFSATGRVTTAIGASSDHGYDVALQSDGKIVVAGDSHNGSNYDFAVVRYNVDGTLDTTFNGTGKATTDFGGFDDFGGSVALQSNGKIVVAGTSYTSSTAYRFALVRYNTNGSLDTTFNGTGIVTTTISGYDIGLSVVAQADGRIVVAGYSYNPNPVFTLVRYNANGSLDTTFNGTGKVTTAIGGNSDVGQSVVVQGDGKIVVAGRSYGFTNDFALVRYNANGSLDAGFGNGGKVTTAIGDSDDRGHGVALQSDGKIVVVGISNGPNYDDFALVRYNINGSLDTSFGVNGKVTTAIGSGNDQGFSVALQSDGKIVVAGASNSAIEGSGLVRYNADGSLDLNFADAGKVTNCFGSENEQAYNVAIQNDGKVVVTGYSSNGSNYDFAVARYEGIDTTTRPPTLTTPPPNTVSKSPVAMAFSLAESALSGMVKLTFNDGAVLRTFTLATSEESQGAHAFTFDPANPLLSASIASGPVIPDGTYTVSISYQDELGNPAASASATDVVIDTTPPALTLPANIVAEASGASGAVVSFSVSANDAVSGAVTPMVSPASGSTFGFGATTVNVSATDGVGNTATGSFTVTVQDTTKPTLSMPPNMIVEATGASGRW